MPEEKKVDEEWKRRAAQEKEKAADGMKAEDLPLGKPDFAMFVAGLGTQALVHLGDVPDPGTGETKTQLGAAKYTIDVLALLEEKTAGNLTDEENGHLEGLLYELRMRYVSAVGGA